MNILWKVNDARLQEKDGCRLHVDVVWVFGKLEGSYIHLWFYSVAIWKLWPGLIFVFTLREFTTQANVNLVGNWYIENIKYMIYSHILTSKEIRTYRYVRQTIFACVFSTWNSRKKSNIFCLAFGQPQNKNDRITNLKQLARARVH
jgi:hypothetical protein